MRQGLLPPEYLVSYFSPRPNRGGVKENLLTFYFDKIAAFAFVEKSGSKKLQRLMAVAGLATQDWDGSEGATTVCGIG